MTDLPATTIELGDRVRTTVKVSIQWPHPWTAPVGTLGTVDSQLHAPVGDFAVILDGDPSGFPVALSRAEFEAAG